MQRCCIFQVTEHTISVNMRVINPSLVTEAILTADVSLIDCTTDRDSERDVAEVPSSES